MDVVVIILPAINSWFLRCTEPICPLILKVRSLSLMVVYNFRITSVEPVVELLLEDEKAAVYSQISAVIDFPTPENQGTRTWLDKAYKELSDNVNARIRYTAASLHARANSNSGQLS
jgi:hypothetical protein